MWRPCDQALAGDRSRPTLLLPVEFAAEHPYGSEEVRLPLSGPAGPDAEQVAPTFTGRPI